jgi:hypothetical protein
MEDGGMTDFSRIPEYLRYVATDEYRSVSHEHVSQGIVMPWWSVDLVCCWIVTTSVFRG